MPKNLRYRSGWIDTTIHDFLSEIDDPPSSMAYALVTCLDSSFDVASLASRNPKLKGLKEHGKPLGQGVLLSSRRLIALERRQRMLFGFDEVWFFSKSRVAPKPKRVVITGPGKISAETMKAATAWMQRNGGSLGLGDGTGMNFCARLPGVAWYLVESLNAVQSAGSGKQKDIA